MRTPEGLSSWDCFDRLLSEAHVVSTPGAGFGAVEGVPGAHVSPGASQSALNPQLLDIKRDRRPTYLIGAGVLTYLWWQNQYAGAPLIAPAKLTPAKRSPSGA